ncbi:hypothetical protein MRX96_041813 [Rhipicephalus microplus]
MACHRQSCLFRATERHTLYEARRGLNAWDGAGSHGEGGGSLHIAAVHTQSRSSRIWWGLLGAEVLRQWNAVPLPCACTSGYRVERISWYDAVRLPAQHTARVERSRQYSTRVAAS